MEGFAQYPQLPPDKEENKALRKYYFSLAWIVITLVLIFSPLDQLLIRVCGGILGGGFTKEQITAGRQIIRADPVMAAIFSYGFPIIADICAIAVGVAITKTDLKSKLRRVDMSGKAFMKTTAVTFGTATAASLVNALIIMILLVASGGLKRLTASDAANAVSVVSQGNPLWLDLIIYFYVCLLGPVLEELVFRGVLLEGLRKYGNLFGIVMSAVFFGLMHQNIVQCVPAIAIGIVWGYAAVLSGSLIPSILLHIFNNTMSAVMMIMLEQFDLNSLMANPKAMVKELVPLLWVSGIFMLFRVICIIAMIVLMAKNRRKLIETDGYTKPRTWKYLFTSLPWIAVTVYLLVTTVASVTKIA